MKFVPSSIPDVVLLEPRVFEDERGFFMETWQRRHFENAGINSDFVQDNHSMSKRGTLRGLHYQLHRPQGKLVRVTAGEIFDVAVDLRRSSKTFGQWVGEYLSAENKRLLWVPPNFAHGFYVVSETAEVQYKCTDYYAPQDEQCIRWDDAEIGVQWPLEPGVELLMSPKDREGQWLMGAATFE